MAIRGDTSAMGLDEMVAFLTRNGLEGVLRIASKEAKVRLFVHAGRLLCPCADRPRIPTPPRGTPALERSKQTPKRKKKPPSGTINRNDMSKLLSRAKTLRVNDRRDRIEKALPGVLRWKDASYSFEPRDLPEALVRDLEDTGLVLDPTALVMEAARQADEGTRARRPARDPRTSCEELSRSGTRVTRRLTTQRPDPRPAAGGHLTGDLRGVGLPALLQDLRTTQRTGTLAITAGGCTEKIHFHRGNAYLMNTVGEGEAFVRYLVGDAGAATLSGLSGHQVHEDELGAERQRELKSRFLDMLFWEDAEFTFEAGELPLEFYVPCPRTAKVELDTERFLLKAIGAMEEWDGIRRAIGGASAILRFRDPSRKIDWVKRIGHFLTLVDGRRSFDDLVRRAGVDRLWAGRTIARLVKRRVVERVPASVS